MATSHDNFKSAMNNTKIMYIETIYPIIISQCIESKKVEQICNFFNTCNIEFLYVYTELPVKYKNNEMIAISLMRNKCAFYMNLSDNMKSNRAILEILISTFPKLILNNNYTINGKPICDDIMLIKKAITFEPKMYIHLSEHIKNNKDIARHVTECSNCVCVSFLPEAILHDSSLVDYIASINTVAYQLIHEQFHTSNSLNIHINTCIKHMKYCDAQNINEFYNKLPDFVKTTKLNNFYGELLC
jgi:hypothetical protein